MIRIVGLSATLPNYKDVASFLGVNLDTGLFYFDASYRPVPLEMQFVGVTEKNSMQARNIQDDICYEKVRCEKKRFFVEHSCFIDVKPVLNYTTWHSVCIEDFFFGSGVSSHFFFNRLFSVPLKLGLIVLNKISSVDCKIPMTASTSKMDLMIYAKHFFSQKLSG